MNCTGSSSASARCVGLAGDETPPTPTSAIRPRHYLASRLPDQARTAEAIRRWAVPFWPRVVEAGDGPPDTFFEAARRRGSPTVHSGLDVRAPRRKPRFVTLARLSVHRIVRMAGRRETNAMEPHAIPSRSHENINAICAAMYLKTSVVGLNDNNLYLSTIQESYL